MERPMRWRLWIVAVLIIIVVLFAIDWIAATAQLQNITIEATFDPPQVIADGRSKSVLTVRITENGKPRAGDLVQLWLGSGSGLLIPNWVFTDESGVALVTYTPNPYSAYDPQDGAQINISDTGIGRLIEVSKRQTIDIKLIKPTTK
jgi:hypothetical protein